MAKTGKYYESEYEQAIIEKLKDLGWQYTYGGQIDRMNTDILLEGDLCEYMRDRYVDDDLTEAELEEIIANLKNINETSLYHTLRKRFITYRDGMTLSRKEGEDVQVEYINFENPYNNILRVVNQFEVGYGSGGDTRRPDVLLFVNGIPVCIFELKNPFDYKATIREAWLQIHHRYEADIPSLISYTALSCISDGSNSRLGTPFTPYEYYYAWKKVNNDDDAARPGLQELDTMLSGVFAPLRFLNILQDYVYFPDLKLEKDEEVVCRYPQFFATEKLYANILEHSTANGGDGKGGTYFGATGCGKTYTMIFLARQLARKKPIGSPTIVVIVDRDDLQDQTGKLFVNSSDFLDDSAVRVIESRADLKKELGSRPSGGVFVCTIQKFEESTGLLSSRSNIICFSDEAHRSQTNIGSSLKLVTDSHDKDGKPLKMGAFISYGYAKYLHDSFPKATFVGFTGTPIDETIHVFGREVDRYTMDQAVADGITVKIRYTPRLARVMTNDVVKQIEDYYKKCYDEGANPEDIEKSKKAMSSMQVILSDQKRLEKIASDIYAHYEKMCEDQPDQPQKAMIVCSRREIAFRLYNVFKKIAPEWFEKRLSPYHDKWDEGELKEDEIQKLEPMETIHVICDRAKNDPPEMVATFGTKEEQKKLAIAYKNAYTNFRVVIVVDMWVTGFDCPSLSVLYNDKPLQKHNLVQTISRVNRRFKRKEYGLIVDYIGIRDNMREAMKQYGGEKQFSGEDEVQLALDIYREEVQVIQEMMHGFNLMPFFGDNPLKRLQIIQEAAEYVMGNPSKIVNEKGKSIRFLTNFKHHVKNLRAAYVICHPAGVLNEEETAWGQLFMGICSYINKMTSTQYDMASMNSQVEKMVSEAIRFGEIEDVYDESLKIEDLASAEFKENLNDVKMPNTKFQILVKQLKRAIKEYGKTNKLAAHRFEKLLEDTVEDYNNRDNLNFVSQVAGDAIAGIQGVVDETLTPLTDRLLALLKDLNAEKESFKKLGITFEEKAFYDVLTSVRDMYKFEYADDKCIELSHKIKDLVDNMTMHANWNDNQYLKNQLNVALGKLLYKNKYPTKWSQEVYEKVLEQVENYTSNL